MEKIFANDVTDRDLMSKIYKHFIQFNIKKKKNQKIYTRPKHFSKQDKQMANSHMKKKKKKFSIAKY